MSRMALDHLRSKALELPELERAELAHDLVASLDGPADLDAAEQWDKEILRRLSQIDDGSIKTIDRAELTRQLGTKRDLR